jgi:hypothetical protein
VAAPALQLAVRRSATSDAIAEYTERGRHNDPNIGEGTKKGTHVDLT